MSVCCDCCVLLSIGLCDELIIRPEESYCVCGVSEYGRGTSQRRPSPTRPVEPRGLDGGICTYTCMYVFIAVSSYKLFRLNICLQVKLNTSKLFTGDRRQQRRYASLTS